MNKDYKIILENDILKIYGSVNLYNITKIIRKSDEFTKNKNSILIDLKNVSISNSGILIYIINRIKISKEKKKFIKFLNIPIYIMNLSKIYNLYNIIKTYS